MYSTLVRQWLVGYSDVLNFGKTHSLLACLVWALDRSPHIVSFQQDMFLIAAMGPPGGGRMVISRRLQSRFNLINMTFPQVSHFAQSCQLLLRLLPFISGLSDTVSTSNICWPATAFDLVSFPGSAGWYMWAWKSPHALHPISQKFPQCCL